MPARDESYGYYSVIARRSFLSLLLVASLTHCASNTRNTIGPAEKEAIQIERLIDTYSEIRSPCVQAFFRNTLARLTARLPRQRRFAVTVLNSEKVFAFSSHNGQIALSKGLIKGLPSEAELAFVLSHEIAHQVLELPAALSETATETERHQAELAADHKALGIVALAGYDIRTSPNAILHAYSASGRNNLYVEGEGYPSLKARVVSLDAEIAASGWRPPGTIDSREFRKIKKLL